MSERMFRLGLPIVFALAVVAFGVRQAQAQNDDGAGITFSKTATSADVGLPVYPGAKPHKSPGSDTDAARLGAWGGAFGFHLAVMQLESTDAAPKIAEYYKKALSKYGAVLDCSYGSAQHSAGANGPVCDDKPAKSGEFVFKAGTNQKQHLVEIEPSDRGSTFALVYVWTKD